MRLRVPRRSTASPCPPARAVWRDDPRHAVSLFTTAALTAALGVSVFLAGPGQFTSLSYTELRETFGGIQLWGAVLIAGGMWLTAALWLSTRAVRVALLGTGALHLFLAFTFAAADNNLDGVSPWGWILFTGLAVRHVTVALHFPGRAA